MEPIKNIGATDYQMALTQPQTAQIPADYEDYSSMPMVYEPQAEQKSSGVGMLGMTLIGLGAAAIGGIAGHKIGGSGLKEAKTKAAEAVKKYETIAKEKETLETSLKEYRKDEGWKGPFKRLWRVIRPSAWLSDEEKAARKVAQAADKETAKAAKDAKKTEKAAEKAQNADKTEK